MRCKYEKKVISLSVSFYHNYGCDTETLNKCDTEQIYICGTITTWNPLSNKIEKYLRKMKEKASSLRHLLSQLPPLASRGDLHTFMDEQRVELERAGIGKKRETEHLPFRTYTVEGGFEVWAGKNGESNDLLTMKHAKPNDLWFHARGASGSHVILKVNTAPGEPGKKARAQAAAVAAYYSKMKKSRLVPVAMTLRKYVRKPKGAPPGTVVLEREEVIFAEPKLPPDR